MRLSTRLGLALNILGIGSNAEATLRANFQKLDEASGGAGRLTGYVPVSAGAVAATDSVNAAIAKLEARIAALE